MKKAILTKAICLGRQLSLNYSTVQYWVGFNFTTGRPYFCKFYENKAYPW